LHPRVLLDPKTHFLDPKTHLLAAKPAPNGLAALLAAKPAPNGLAALLAAKPAPNGLAALLAAKPAPNGLLDPKAAPIGLGSLAALTGGIKTGAGVGPRKQRRYSNAGTPTARKNDTRKKRTWS
jgi:hypothetical protein